MTRDEARHLLAEALATSAADATEARLEVLARGLTRFAENGVHQHVEQRDHVLTLRAWAGRRSGIASTNRFEPSALRRTADRALALARLAPEDEAAPGPAPAPAATCTGPERFVQATADCPPGARADALAPLLADVERRGLDAAGALSTTTQALGLASTAGLFAWHAGTHAHFTCTVRGPDSSGWADAHRADWRALDLPARVATAIDKCERSRAPAAVEPGPWDVILEPAAVAELVQFLGVLGLGARAEQEGRSFLSGRLGERVTGERVTLRDDAADPRGFGRPFDDEGVPRSRPVLIERGIARGVVHDRRTAARAGVASTGHASPPPAAEGPLPHDLVLEPGADTLADLVATTERGLLVTRFWYNRVVDARRTIVTGMTRDGTFRIANGRLAGGVRNLRFNDSVLGALTRADGFTAAAEPSVFEWSGACVVAPALRVRAFTFSSASPF